MSLLASGGLLAPGLAALLARGLLTALLPLGAAILALGPRRTLLAALAVSTGRSLLATLLALGSGLTLLLACLAPFSRSGLLPGVLRLGALLG